MRILIHDYSGHPPQIEISHELSRRGHDVLYLYAKGNRTPRGAVERRSSDPISDSAATHSVPGKVLSHLCAGKPQLAVMPSENHAAQVIRDSGGASSRLMIPQQFSRPLSDCLMTSRRGSGWDGTHAPTRKRNWTFEESERSSRT